MPGTNLTAEEAELRSAALSVESYDISLDLRTATAGADTFTSVTVIRFEATDPSAPVFLDLRAPTLREVVLNGRALDPAEVFHDSRVSLPGLVAGPNHVVVAADCAYTTTGEGLHRFTDPVDESTYLYTQFEVADGRRVFACFDQPDLKARFGFTVTAPRDWRVVSNTPAVTSQDGTWTFGRTARLATYVVSLAAGPFHAVHSEHQEADRTIPLGLYCRRSLADHLDAEDMFAVTRQGLDWFAERFGWPYPFEKYDQIFVPGLNAGAMENAAAVTFNEKYIFRSRATDAAYRKRAATILHELSHMWFGDLVTMKWWDDLWLNESFATYCSFACQALAPASRWADSWTTFANHQKAKAYRQDQLPSTHPVVAEIRDLEDVLVNFDGITYVKGASALKQLAAYVGTDAFFSGVREYIAAHAYGSARFPDLLHQLERASGRDLRTWARMWLETAGINVLRPEIDTDGDGNIATFRVRQEAPALATGAAGVAVLRPHRIAIGFYNRDDAGMLHRIHRTETDVLPQELTDVPQLRGLPRPDLVLLNDDDLTYAKVRFDGHSLRTVTERLGALADPLPRALCWTAAWDMTRDGEFPVQGYLDLVLTNAGTETDIGVVESLHRQVAYALRHYTTPASREQLTARWCAAALERLRAAPPAGDHQLAWARAFVGTASAPSHLDLLVDILDGTPPTPGLAVDTDLRWSVLIRLAAAGRAGEEEIAAEELRDPTPAGAAQAATARAARPEATAKAAAWAAVVEHGNLSNQLQKAVIAGFADASDPALLSPYTPRYFEAIGDIWQGRSHEMAKQVVLGLFPPLSEASTAEAAARWLDTHGNAPAGLRRLVREQYDDACRALNAQDGETSRA